MKVRFNVLEEFVQELQLAHEWEQIAGAIVRLTMRYEQAKQIHFLYRLSVVAGFVAGGQLVYLQQPCGDVMGGDVPHEASDTTRAKAQALAAQITEAAQALYAHCGGRPVLEPEGPHVAAWRQG
jgi:hypothetical protein